MLKDEEKFGIKEFKTYGVELLVHDPMADMKDALKYYDTGLCNWSDLVDLDAIVLCVGHKQYKTLTIDDYRKMLNPGAVLMDVKAFKEAGINLWRL